MNSTEYTYSINDALTSAEAINCEKTIVEVPWLEELAWEAEVGPVAQVCPNAQVFVGNSKNIKLLNT